MNLGQQNNQLQLQQQMQQQQMQQQQMQLQADTEALVGPAPGLSPTTATTSPGLSSIGSSEEPAESMDASKGVWDLIDTSLKKQTSPILTASSSSVGIPQLQPMQGIMQSQQPQQPSQIPQIDKPWLMG